MPSFTIRAEETPPILRHRVERVRNVAQCPWLGAHQTTLDHKSRFHNVPLHSDSWTYFSFEWQKPYKYGQSYGLVGGHPPSFTTHSATPSLSTFDLRASPSSPGQTILVQTEVGIRRYVSVRRSFHGAGVKKEDIGTKSRNIPFPALSLTSQKHTKT